MNLPLTLVARHRATPAAWPIRWWRRLRERLAARRALRELERLDDRTLTDIGLSRAMLARDFNRFS